MNNTSTENKTDAERTRENYSTARWIWKSIKPFHGRFFLLCFLSVANTLVILLNVVLLRDLINAASNKDQALFIRLSFLLVFTTLLDIALNILFRFLSDRTNARIVQYLDKRLFSLLLKKDYVAVSEKHSAEWLNRLVMDIAEIAGFLTSMLPAMCGITVNFVGSAYLIYYIDPLFLVLILVGGLGLFLLNSVLKEPLKTHQRQYRAAVGVKNIYLSEHLSKLLIVKSFNREDDIIRESTSKFEAITRKQDEKLNVMLTKVAAQNFSLRIAYLIVLIYCGANIISGRISYGVSVMFMRLMSQISVPMTEASKYFSKMFDVQVSAERLMEIESYKDDPDGPVRDDKEIIEFYNNEFSDIALEDVAFSYHVHDFEYEDSIPKVFSHVNITVPRHCCAAITGVTGSGKSTMFKLLMSFFTLQEGKKVIHTKDGLELPLDSSFRRLFAYVPQGNQLMAGTIREMVTFGSEPTKDMDERIWRVLEEACAKDFVEALPEGLDTVIKERGAGLSEGQLQRIAVARALYTRRPVLLLDEATSALDEKTEQELLLHLKEMTDRTILFVTHRLNALSICDKEIHINGNTVTVRDLNHGH
jgi:ATP-binding cassette subfamily B protein